MEDQRVYKFAYCEKCGRQLIVPKYDGWTGRELPETTYTCAVCHDKEEKERGKAPTFTGTITPVPPEIIRKIWEDATGEQG